MPLPDSTIFQRNQDKISSYQELLDNLAAAIYLCDADGYVTAYNEAAVALWGRRPEIGKDLWCGSWKIFDLDGTPIPLPECPMALTLKNKKAVAGKEIIIEQPEGKRLHVLPYPKPLFDEAGRLTGAVNLLVDVTNQSKYDMLLKRTEELSSMTQQLKASEELYHKMTAEVEDYAIILLSKNGIIENWNKGAEKIKGYKEDEVRGKHFQIFYPKEDREAGLPGKLIAEAASKGKANHEGWRVRKDGSRFWGNISITALHGERGDIIGFVKVTRDLTERRNQEVNIQQLNEDLKKKNELLRQSEEKYARMVAEVEDYVIILLDVNGTIENWNKGAQKIKGYTSEQVVGKHFSIFYPEEDRKKGLPESILAQAAKDGKALHEGWRLRRDGTSFWGSVVMTALHDENGRVIGFTKVTRDLTEKKQSEEKLLATWRALEQKNRELERINEELSSFAYISSHDLQEPLRKIRTFSDRILDLEYANLSERGKDYFRRMQGGAARMQKLIQDILAYSRTTTSERKLEVTDLNDLLLHAKGELEVMIHDKNAVIESDTLPTIKVIPFQMQQLFNNLLNNALKFSKKDVHPHVIIRSETVDAKNFDGLSAVPVKEYCHLIFQDNGIGFEHEYSRKIFEVFQRLHGRTEYDGTGIGLAICKKIVENHHGFITADGEPGQGATFHIYLPIV